MAEPLLRWRELCFRAWLADVVVAFVSLAESHPFTYSSSRCVRVDVEGLTFTAVVAEMQ
jgi:hypothetical protein